MVVGFAEIPVPGALLWVLGVFVFAQRFDPPRDRRAERHDLEFALIRLCAELPRDGERANCGGSIVGLDALNGHPVVVAEQLNPVWIPLTRLIAFGPAILVDLPGDDCVQRVELPVRERVRPLRQIRDAIVPGKPGRQFVG